MTLPTVDLRGVDYLDEHLLRSGGGGLVFGEGERPFGGSNVWRRAGTAWRRENERRAREGLEPLVPVCLHECRHGYVSLMAAAGVSLERIGDYVGHTTANMTDRYRHLLEGQEAEDARRVDAFLERADTAARLAQLG